VENVKQTIMVLSGKGGVGKSSVAVNLAVWLATHGKNVGLLDVDIHGPSVPKLVNLERTQVVAEGDKIKPLLYNDRFGIMSVGFLLAKDSDALIWRGPMKHNVISQFVTDVMWGELDALVVDCPPGTGDEPLSIVQLLRSAKKPAESSQPAGSIINAVIVTTPQQLAVTDVKKCITFCRQLNLSVRGIVENMRGFVCPKCGHEMDIFDGDGGRNLARQFEVPFLGSIPVDVGMASACDAGRPLLDSHGESPAATSMERAFENFYSNLAEANMNNSEDSDKMKIAIPVTGGSLSLHFGHCEQFVIVDVDPEKKAVSATATHTPPGHAPGVLPKWLSELGVNVVIASGMGQRAQQLFAQHNIEVAVGAAEAVPEKLALDYVSGRLERGANICDH